MFRLALLLLLFAPSPRLSFGQGSELFPPERLRALREEIAWEAPEEPRAEEESPAETTDDGAFVDLSAWRWPLILTVGGLLVVGLGLFVYLILGGLVGGKRPDRETQAAEITPVEMEEDRLLVTGVDQSLLDRAEANGQYAVALRLHYLATLKDLTDAGWLRYRRDYSNRDYREQLRGSDRRAGFVTLAAGYERYWFGAYPIDRLTYRDLASRFLAYRESIPSVQTDGAS